MNSADCHPVIDINADFGEAVTPHQLAIEAAVIGYVTSVNIACGGHAGDEDSMRHAIRIAAQHGAAVGAHPSFPDRANFGRASMNLDPDSLRTTISEQLASLNTIARSEGVPILHCKPHGALYHAASAKKSVALELHQACADFDPNLRLVCQAGSQAVAWWRAWGATVIEEAFIDRVYESNGFLRSRTMPGALITDPVAAAEQACRIATTHTVRSLDGGVLTIEADTLCVHADTQHAAAIAKRVAQALQAAGVKRHSFV